LVDVAATASPGHQTARPATLCMTHLGCPSSRPADLGVSPRGDTMDTIPNPSKEHLHGDHRPHSRCSGHRRRLMSGYTMAVTLDQPYDDVVSRVKDALADQG